MEESAESRGQRGGSNIRPWRLSYGGQAGHVPPPFFPCNRRRPPGTQPSSHKAPPSHRKIARGSLQLYLSVGSACFLRRWESATRSAGGKFYAAPPPFHPASSSSWVLPPSGGPAAALKTFLCIFLFAPRLLSFLILERGLGVDKANWVSSRFQLCGDNLDSAPPEDDDVSCKLNTDQLCRFKEPTRV